jgi:hypothetical protein
MNEAKEPALILIPESTNEGTAFFAGGKSPRMVQYTSDAPEVVQLSADRMNSGLTKKRVARDAMRLLPARFVA